MGEYKEYKENCFFCTYLGSDDCGDDYASHSWPVCDKNENKSNLKSFPFKKEQKCFYPEFWSVMNIDEELSKLHDEDMRKDEDAYSNINESKAWKYFKEKYCRKYDLKERVT